MPPALTSAYLLEIFPHFPVEFRTMLEDYLSGKVTAINSGIFNKATAGLSPFARDVLKATCAIPFGHTATYSDIACAIGKPGAVRAVGAALNRNPLPVLIPCHRVLAKNGIGGYAYGLDIKRRLLKFEGLDFF